MKPHTRSGSCRRSGEQPRTSLNSTNDFASKVDDVKHDYSDRPCTRTRSKSLGNCEVSKLGNLENKSKMRSSLSTESNLKTPRSKYTGIKTRSSLSAINKTRISSPTLKDNPEASGEMTPSDKLSTDKSKKRNSVKRSRTSSVTTVGMTTRSSSAHKRQKVHFVSEKDCNCDPAVEHEYFTLHGKQIKTCKRDILLQRYWDLMEIVDYKDLDKIVPNSLTETNGADHFQKLSIEIMCFIFDFLSIREVLCLESMSKKVQNAVHCSLTMREDIDFLENVSGRDAYKTNLPTLTDYMLKILMTKLPKLKNIYNFHPRDIVRRESRSDDKLTIPGVIEALKTSKTLGGIQISNIFLLEAILTSLPRVKVLKKFQNGSHSFPADISTCITLPEECNVTSLHLVGCCITSLPTMDFHLKHLYLRMVKFVHPSPFKDFSACHLETFVMAHCTGPSSPLRYFNMITSLAEAPKLKRLELQRVPFLGGILQNVCEENLYEGGFRRLHSITMGGCKNALDADLGYLVIAAAARLETLYIQPSLTKDCFFSALAITNIIINPGFDRLSLGWVDVFPDTDEWSKDELFAEGLSDAGDVQSRITDSGMRLVGQCFPPLKSLELYNCPHLQNPMLWFSQGLPYFTHVKELTLRACHSIKLCKFSTFLQYLPQLEYLTLEDMFKEQPIGCSRVGLSAGTGLGVSNALVTSHYQPAAGVNIQVGQPVNQNPLGNQPANQNPLGNQPANQNPLGDQPANQNPLDNQPANQNPLDNQPANQVQDNVGNLDNIAANENDNAEDMDIDIEIDEVVNNGDDGERNVEDQQIDINNSNDEAHEPQHAGTVNVSATEPSTTDCSQRYNLRTKRRSHSIDNCDIQQNSSKQQSKSPENTPSCSKVTSSKTTSNCKKTPRSRNTTRKDSSQSGSSMSSDGAKPESSSKHSSSNDNSRNPDQRKLVTRKVTKSDEGLSCKVKSEDKTVQEGSCANDQDKNIPGASDQDNLQEEAPNKGKGLVTKHGIIRRSKSSTGSGSSKGGTKDKEEVSEIKQEQVEDKVVLECSCVTQTVGVGCQATMADIKDTNNKLKNVKHKGKGKKSKRKSKHRKDKILIPGVFHPASTNADMAGPGGSGLPRQQACPLHKSGHTPGRPGPHTRSVRDECNSTYDPVMEDDHPQLMQLVHPRLEYLCINCVGITDLDIVCKNLRTLSISRCRVLKKVNLKSTTFLEKVHVSQCRKFDEKHLLDQIYRLPACTSKFVSLRPLHPVQEYDLYGHIVFSDSYTDYNFGTVMLFDFSTTPSLTNYNKLRMKSWIDLLEKLSTTTMEEYNWPKFQDMEHPNKGLDKIEGHSVDGSPWLLMSDLPWISDLNACPNMEPQFIKDPDWLKEGVYCPEVKGHFSSWDAYNDLQGLITSLGNDQTGLYDCNVITYVNLCDVSGIPTKDAVNLI